MLRDDLRTQNALRDAFERALTGHRAWSAVITKANELASADTIRVVRCPEVEVAGALPQIPTNREVVVEYETQYEPLLMLHQPGAAVISESVRRWCIPGEPWHERTTQRVRRWDAASVPETGVPVVVYYDNGDSKRMVFRTPISNYRAENFNKNGQILAWHLDPLAPDAERAE
jgi:hypothetical protein